MKPEFKNKAIILGVKIDDISIDHALNRVDQYLGSFEKHKIYTPNPEICLKAESDSEYRHVLNSADLNLPDGFGLKLGAKILNVKLENRVAGSDFTRELLNKYDKESKKVFIVLRDDSLTTEDDLKKLFADKYSNLKYNIGIVKKNDPFNCDEVLNDINEFEPELLFVCLGAPNQEIWINKFQKLLTAKVFLGVGGSFDFLTGRIKRAPKVMRDLGVEWLYRLYQEPKRLARIKNATADFLLTCHKWKKRIATEYRKNVLGVVTKDNKYLVQKNPRFNHWQFPQGGIDQDESPEDAVIREVSEEVGCQQNKLSIIKKIPETHTYDAPPHAQLLQGNKGQAQTAFLLEFKGVDSDFKFGESHEVEEIKWVAKGELLDVIHHHRHEFVRKILKHLQ